MPVGRLNITVLVRVAWKIARRPQTIVIDQLTVARREVSTTTVRQFVRGCREIVSSMLTRNSAKAPQCRLQSRAQRLEALARTDRYRLPVRVSQHAVIDRVRKRLTLDTQLQRAHVREVRLRLLAGHMDLGKEHFAIR